MALADTYDETQPLAKGLAELMAQTESKAHRLENAKAIENGEGFYRLEPERRIQTTAGVNSLRAKTHRPYVSMPVQWKELESAIETKDAEALFFTPELSNALKRLAICSSQFWKQVQRLPAELRWSNKRC